MAQPIVYALDFDGVICNSAVETGITGWKVAGKIWDDMPDAIPEMMIAQFQQVRPIIETGYEAVLAMRLLHLGDTVDTIYADFSNKAAKLMAEAAITVEDLKKLFGETRDAWIAEDMSGWIRMNPLFSGVAEKLKQLNHGVSLIPWYIVTTKQERFVKKILIANWIAVTDEQIFGLDRNMSKTDVLTELQSSHQDAAIYFLEDRLPTLIKVAKTKHLQSVKLHFALWGYNTAEDKVLAREHHFTCQQLENFLE